MPWSATLKAGRVVRKGSEHLRSNFKVMGTNGRAKPEPKVFLAAPDVLLVFGGGACCSRCLSCLRCLCHVAQKFLDHPTGESSPARMGGTNQGLVTMAHQDRNAVCRHDGAGHGGSSRPDCVAGQRPSRLIAL